MTTNVQVKWLSPSLVAITSYAEHLPENGTTIIVWKEHIAPLIWDLLRLYDEMEGRDGDVLGVVGNYLWREASNTYNPDRMRKAFQRVDKLVSNHITTEQFDESYGE